MLAYVALTVAMLLWASSYIALKYVFAIFDPYVVLAARMAICTLCLAPFVWSAWRRIDRQIGAKFRIILQKSRTDPQAQCHQQRTCHSQPGTKKQQRFQRQAPRQHIPE